MRLQSLPPKWHTLQPGHTSFKKVIPQNRTTLTRLSIQTHKYKGAMCIQIITHLQPAIASKPLLNLTCFSYISPSHPSLYLPPLSVPIYINYSFLKMRSHSIGQAGFNRTVIPNARSTKVYFPSLFTLI